MSSIQQPSLLELAATMAIGPILYYLYLRITTYISRRNLIAQHGCKPIKSNPEMNGFPNNIFGTKIFRENVAAFKSQKLVEVVSGRFLRNGNTTHAKVFLTDIYQTIEPENLKCIMGKEPAGRFSDWCLADRRKDAFVPLLGHGIFTSDGAAWENSRALLRPNFDRKQVANLDTFEIHIAHLVQAIPRDGSTVDLQDLFFKLTMDTATEFLFGESAGSLNADADVKAGVDFAEAFTGAQLGVGEVTRGGMIAEWMRDNKAFEKNVRYCHDFVDQFVRRGLAYRKRLDEGEKDPRAGERYVFLYELAKATNDPVQIRAECLNVLLAGRDTTASLLSDVFFVLARRPDIWMKLRAELDEFGKERPSFQQLQDMTYLKWIINESTCSSPPSHLLLPSPPTCYKSQSTMNTNRLTRQPFASTPSSRSTRGNPASTPCSLLVVAKTANPPSSSPRAKCFNGRYTQCTAARTSTATTRTTSGPRDGSG